MKKVEIVRDFITKNNISDDIPNKTIARRLHQEFPEVFFSLENARDVVRNARGNKAVFNRESIKDPEKRKFFRENRDPAKVGREWNLTPIDISIQPYIMKYKKILVLCDIHLGHHDVNAVNFAVEYGLKKGCDCILLNGDTLDAHKLSTFQVNPNAPGWAEERDMFWSLIDWLQDDIKKPIVFKMGNHEDRWNKFLLRRAPELFGLPELAIQGNLKLTELGIDFVDTNQIIQAGNLDILHGHEFGSSVYNPVSPSRSLFIKARQNVLFGHGHTTSSHIKKSSRGEYTRSYSVGSLCQLTPDYRPMSFTECNLGFALVHIQDDAEFEVYNERIDYDKNGKIYIVR